MVTLGFPFDGCGDYFYVAGEMFEVYSADTTGDVGGWIGCLTKHSGVDEGVT